jgi:hypothetical protein
MYICRDAKVISLRQGGIMKKLILAVTVLMLSVNIFTLTLNDLDAETKANVIECLEGKIELKEGETIVSVEGEEYDITVISNGFVWIVDKDGNIIIVPKS